MQSSLEVAELCGMFAVLWLSAIGYTSESLAASVLLSLFVVTFGIALCAHTDFMLPTTGRCAFTVYPCKGCCKR